MCSSAACKDVRIRSRDLSNAYFNAENLDRLSILATPKGGLPGLDASRNAVFAANKFLHGTKDAGRRFYLKVRKAAIESGMRACKTMKSSYYVANDKGQIVLLMAAHVDDAISVRIPEYKHILDTFLLNFEVKNTEEIIFRFCG